MARLNARRRLLQAQGRALHSVLASRAVEGDDLAGKLQQGSVKSGLGNTKSMLPAKAPREPLWETTGRAPRAKGKRLTVDGFTADIVDTLLASID